MMEAMHTPSADRLLSVLASAQPGASAVVVPDDGVVLSFAELAERVDRLARTLAGAGATRGSGLRGAPERARNHRAAACDQRDRGRRSPAESCVHDE